MRNLHPDMWPIKWRLLAKVSGYLLYNYSVLQFNKIKYTQFLKYISFFILLYSATVTVWSDIIAGFGLMLTPILLTVYLLRFSETFSVRLPWWRLFEVGFIVASFNGLVLGIFCCIIYDILYSILDIDFVHTDNLPKCLVILAFDDWYILRILRRQNLSLVSCY